MHEIGLTLKNLSPLALSENRSSQQFGSTLNFIPGSALRGALAAIFLRGDDTRAADPAFSKLFLEDQVYYSDLLPAVNPGEPVILLPQSAWGCKRFPQEHATFATDTLLRLELADTLQALSHDGWQKPLEDIQICPKCQEKSPKSSASSPGDRLHIEYSAGYPPLQPYEVPHHMITGTAVDRATGTVASSLLFSYDTLDRGQYFSGHLRINTHSDLDLSTCLQELAPRNSTLHIGHGRSRGLGHVQVVAWHVNPKPAAPQLNERWHKLNRVVRRLWKKYKAGEPAYAYFTLTLDSHLALTGAAGQPLLDDLSPADLGLPWVEWGRRILDPVAVAGWCDAWGLPKYDTWALRRGSVLLGRIPKTQEKATLDRLTILENEGAGERRAEGMGHLRVCDPFHYEITL